MTHIKQLALTLICLTPFFSLADIFNDGTIDVRPPQTDSEKIITSDNFGGIFVGQRYENPQYYCDTYGLRGYLDTYAANIIVSEFGTSFDCMMVASSYEVKETRGVSFQSMPSKTCPPDAFPNYTYPIDHDGDGEIDGCANPFDIQQNDSCQSGSENQFLNIPVSVQSGCFPQPDGSVCEYKAASSNGIEYYEMDLEGDCYSDPNGKPDINGTPAETPQSSDDICYEWGGTGLICPEKKEDVCRGSGSYASDPQQECPNNCGYVNAIFACLDNDTDGDSVPDYLDPDIDGDGVPNGDDLDNNGDGVDDPVKPNSNGNASVNVDLGPVVNKLEEIKKSISETTVEIRTKPKDGLVSLWESDYEDGLSGVMSEKFTEIQDTAFYSFLDTLVPSISGGAPPNYNFCMNFGSYMNFGCFDLVFPVDIFAFIKVCILLYATFTCRRILFGG